MEVIVTTAVESSKTVVREIFMTEKRRPLCLCQTMEGSVKYEARNSRREISADAAELISKPSTVWRGAFRIFSAHQPRDPR